ncbi:hypothetical protein DYB25_006128 [Aphanomyces astaci]|nr:hypothetical protein DYB25_006128 [Aphanomyces astaci]
MTPHPRPVMINHRSAWLSGFYLVNLVCMPFLVYLTEVSPLAIVHRQNQPPFPLAPALTHALAQQYVAQFQILYNVTTLPRNTGYVYDRDRVVDVMRTVVSPSDCANPSTLLNGILGVAYFTPDAKSAVLSCVCGNTTTVDVRRAWRLNLIVAPSSTNALWIVPGNDLNGHMGASYTVYYLFVPDKLSAPWLIAKFVYRGLLSVAILGLALRGYYRHIRQLRTDLTRFPLQPPTTNGNAIVRYDVVVGEPSCLIMSSPWVCLAFVADIIASTEYMGQSCLRLCQTQNLIYFGMAMVYLGRLVWCAYGTLAAHNAVRKRWKWTALSSPVDSTQVVVLVYFVGGFLTFVQALWPALISVYTWLFCLDSIEAFDAPDRRLVAMNIALVIFVYLLTICGTPYIVTAGTQLTRRLFPRGVGYSCRKVRHSVSQQRVGGSRRRSPARSPDSTNSATLAVLRPPALLTPNDTKGYIRQWFCPIQGSVACVGGSMYQLFHAHPGVFQVQGTINQTASDCFVCGYDKSDVLVEVVCVSLVSQVDLTPHKHDSRDVVTYLSRSIDSIGCGTTTVRNNPLTEFAVGRLVVGGRRDDGGSGAPSIELRRGANNSAWIM